MNILYTLSILLYGLGIRIAAWFNPKARKWVRGRRGNIRRLTAMMKEGGDRTGSVWFHCASLGEFEQGRPVIERFRELYPGYRIVLTFYSPSGFDVRHDYPGADGIFYLPLDTPRNARRWIRTLKPKLVFFIKYEYWFHFLTELNRNNIPVFIISAIFHRNQPFFKWYGSWFRKRLGTISWFFLQSEEGKSLAEELGINNYTITGDTRFDRVWNIRQQPSPFPLLERFKGDARIFLAGSTWEPDEALVAELIKQDLPGIKFIIAPHEVHTSRIGKLEGSLWSAVGTPQSAVHSQHPPAPLHHCTTAPVILRYSGLHAGNAAAARILIIDSIGILAQAYRYTSFAMIGGGFGVGIHNILEAAAFGNPVFFGPNYTKFTEARELVRLGGAFCVTTASGLIRYTKDLLNDPDAYQRISSISRIYVENGQGATQRILQGIQTLGFIAPSGNHP